MIRSCLKVLLIPHMEPGCPPNCTHNQRIDDKPKEIELRSFRQSICLEEYIILVPLFVKIGLKMAKLCPLLVAACHFCAIFGHIFGA